MSSNMTSLSTTLAALEDGFNARSVTSTDSNNTFVTATATKASTGSYEVKVASVATRGQIAPTLSEGSPTNLAVADPAASIATGAASFAVRGTDGVLKAFQLNNNSLNGLRDAINSSGAGVTATIINSGKGANPYQLVVTAKDTGTKNNRPSNRPDQGVPSWLQGSFSSRVAFSESKGMRYMLLLYFPQIAAPAWMHRRVPCHCHFRCPGSCALAPGLFDQRHFRAGHEPFDIDDDESPPIDWTLFILPPM